MLRWTKTSPGFKPRMVVSGHRASEQPIHRISGCWPFARLGNRPGFDCATAVAQVLLEVNDWRYVSTDAQDVVSRGLRFDVLEKGLSVVYIDFQQGFHNS